jgi:hypothetical protein
MRIRSPLLVVALLVLTSSAAAAQVRFAPRPEKDPYRNLFGGPVRAQKPTAPKPATPSPSPSPQKPFVVCGTLVVPANPGVDPKIRVAPPAGVEHTMRILIPPMCQPG